MGMTEGREREIKLEFSGEEDYRRFLDALPEPAEVKEQRNHYFDLPDRALRAAGVMLRLRIEPKGARITVKEKAVRDGAGLFDVAETEETVDREAAEAVAGGNARFADLGGTIVESLSARFGDILELARWGTLTNRRSVHPLDSGFTLEVDRAVYPDGTVLHEVECESEDPNGARSEIERRLAAIGVVCRPSTASKAERLARSAGE